MLVAGVIVLFAGLALAMANGPFHLPYQRLRADAGGATDVTGVVASELYAARSITDSTFAPPSRRILGGAITVVMEWSKKSFLLLFGGLAALSALGAALAMRPRTRRVGVAISLAGLVALSAVGSLRLSDGWDEFYINLRHSQNIITHGTYSMNASERVEATVDLVPFAAAGLVSRWTGVLPDDVAMAFGLSGNALLIIGVFAFVLATTTSVGLALVMAAFTAVFPPLLFVGFSGFMATFFGGLILAALYLFLIRRGRWSFRAHILLGLLTFVRVEAVALGLLLWGLTLCGGAWRNLSPAKRRAAWIRRAWRPLGARLLAIALPFVLLSLGRYAFFGHALPVPVVFKNTNGNFGYLFTGALQIREFYHAFSLGPALLVCAVPVALLLVARGWRWFAAALALLLFSLTYLTGGGDWFPIGWARYWIALFALLIVLSASALHNVLRALRVPLASTIVTGAFAAYALHAALTPKTAFSEAGSHLVLSHKVRWNRVDDLARLGSLLRRTSDSTWRIGSPEVATIMFFAQRDIVGLMGIDNWEVAQAPLMPTGPGDRLHRRRNPQTLERHRPEIIALYEPAVTVRPYQSRLIAQRDVQRQLMPNFAEEIGYFRAGSYDFLQALGYHSLTVQDGTHLFTYWIHASVLPAHLAKLKAAGFAPQGIIHIPYNLPDSLTHRYRASTGAFADLHARRADAVAQVALAGAAAERALLPTIKGTAPFGALFTTADDTPPRGGTVRFALTPSRLGELRVPIALGPTDGNVTLTLRRVAHHTVVEEVPVPEGIGNRWLVLRAKMPVDQGALELVGEDHGASRGWFAIGRPWWMGEGAGRAERAPASAPNPPAQ